MRNHDTIGGTTRDLITLHQPHPTEHPTTDTIEAREHLNRRYGIRAGISGATLILGTLLAVALMPENVVHATPILVAHTLIACCVAVGAVFVVAWAVERLTRYNRTLTRQTLAELHANRRQVADLTAALTTLTATVGGFDGRFTALEHKIKELPDYGQGVIDGVQMRQDVTTPDT